MKKITIIGIILTILLVGTVSAITIGQKITQEQLDNQDIQNFDLEPTFRKIDGNIQHEKYEGS